MVGSSTALPLQLQLVVTQLLLVVEQSSALLARVIFRIHLPIY